MNNSKPTLKILSFLALSLSQNFNIVAYEAQLHQKMTTEHVMKRSENKLNNVEWLGFNLNFKDQNALDDIRELVGQGAFKEDHPAEIKAMNHFFDPINGTALSNIPNNFTSPNWILNNHEDDLIFDGNGYDSRWPYDIYSYEVARNLYYEALVNQDIDKRLEQWNELFVNLGAVIHHIQDMAQPQHVRDDHHIHSGIPWIDIPLGIAGIHEPSIYEQATYEWSKVPDLNNPGMTLDILSYDGYSTPEVILFNNPEDYWKNENNFGLAQFTNSNFFSLDTIYSTHNIIPVKYPSPIIIGYPEQYKVKFDIAELCLSYVYACSDDTKLLSGYVQFIGTSFNDALTMQSGVNSMSASYSVFAEDLKWYAAAKTAKGESIYSLNKFNYLIAQSYLIPRAVAYSTSMINYFFRGEMEISLPEDGVFAVADHQHIFGLPGGDGFEKVKLKIKNTTPTGELMDVSGKLKAVVRFRRNSCYESDLSGELNDNDPQPSICVSNQTEYVSSLEESIPLLGINDSPQEVTFTFPFTSRIPFNATDVFLQVVYRGKLGEEDDAVVVATKDISEPTFIGFYNYKDQFVYKDNDGQFVDFKDSTSCSYYSDYDQCRMAHAKKRHIRFTDPGFVDDNDPFSNFGAVVEWNEIPVGSYSRVAILGDVDIDKEFDGDGFPSSFMNIYFVDDDPNLNSDPPYYDENVNPYRYQLTYQQYFDDYDNRLIVNYFEFRGIFLNGEDINLFNGGTEGYIPPDFDPLTPVPAIICFNDPQLCGASSPVVAASAASQ